MFSPAKLAVIERSHFFPQFFLSSSDFKDSFSKTSSLWAVILATEDVKDWFRLPACNDGWREHQLHLLLQSLRGKRNFKFLLPRFLSFVKWVSFPELDVLRLILNAALLRVCYCQKGFLLHTVNKCCFLALRFERPWSSCWEPCKPPLEKERSLVTFLPSCSQAEMTGSMEIFPEAGTPFSLIYLCDQG